MKEEKNVSCETKYKLEDLKSELEFLNLCERQKNFKDYNIEWQNYINKRIEFVEEKLLKGDYVK